MNSPKNQPQLLPIVMSIITVLVPICVPQSLPSAGPGSPPAAHTSFFRDDSESNKTKICVPELDNVSTRSVNLNFLRERLIKLLQKKTISAAPAEGTATHPDYAQARDSGCTYLLRVEIHELRFKTAQPGMTIGSPRTPDVAEPESLNKRYAASLDFELTRMGQNESVVDSVANGESDTEMQAAANAVDFVANRVLAAVKKNK
jgi:hypothetical protein